MAMIRAMARSLWESKASRRSGRYDTPTRPSDDQECTVLPDDNLNARRVRRAEEPNST